MAAMPIATIYMRRHCIVKFVCCMTGTTGSHNSGVVDLTWGLLIGAYPHPNLDTSHRSIQLAAIQTHVPNIGDEVTRANSHTHEYRIVYKAAMAAHTAYSLAKLRGKNNLNVFLRVSPRLLLSSFATRSPAPIRIGATPPSHRRRESSSHAQRGSHADRSARPPIDA